MPPLETLLPRLILSEPESWQEEETLTERLGEEEGEVRLRVEDEDNKRDPEGEKGLDREQQLEEEKNLRLRSSVEAQGWTALPRLRLH